MQTDLKLKIKDLVAQYKRIFPEEYHATIEYLKNNRKLLKNEFADLTKEGTNALERGLYEIPETLDNIFRMKLKDHERMELESKDGGRWFVRTFPEFSMGNKA